MPKNEPLPPRPVLAVLDKDGREILDPIPMAPPVGYRAELSQDQRLRQMVIAEHNRLRAELYDETEDEANDFDIPDDPIDPNTPYEEYFDPVDAEARMRLRDDNWRRMVDERLRALNPIKEPPNGSDTRQDGEELPEKLPARSDRDKQPSERKIPSTRIQDGLRKGSDRATEDTRED